MTKSRRVAFIVLLATVTIFSSTLFVPSTRVSHALRIQFGDDSYYALLEEPLREDVNERVPLIVVLHGYGGTISSIRSRSELSFLTLGGFGVLYVQARPDDTGQTHWNASMTLTARDDRAALVGIVQMAQARYHFDPQRSFVVGYSNGGFMAYSLACHNPGVFAAVASVNGTMSGADWVNCPARGSVPLFHSMGGADDVVPGDGTMNVADGWGGAPAALKVVESWAADSGARTRIEKMLDDRVSEATWFTQRGQMAAKLVTFQDLGHDWPDKRFFGVELANEIEQFFLRVMREHPAP
ncbi:PHB depolymerase family esterase [Mesobacterium sp. TK19101]|uniref:PHB depolymerase family esterase n=1 Tax=Mesobacterium hydrothermale TaxID=3111907 RepID=A0ABU6HD44_9RHOB|nr:PHB depolymerase family esterase [Mesobacterium sp. TK19101]MEC3860311.1 PHB depolymerase family esterase [Mesobacterium sp. TK19101]